ncbi:endoplasmic reticulum-Golgi intermediate compartment protein 2 [Nomia melanderi]|uniref:endoplasmic reticulum-Golgi intermediate compartment protein 2 n=1 Tax=Nomia melanderi TaxID=2448451 RepID=UPI0013043C0A|nr:endoplasmic reticulum-Golgi intermediate compartment protein 2 [Nomia melanderi]XP_031847594.1 endoplasmic reticulum-Golgi intermediate compartment protein 2 [Nomia melanderi]XP_031847595.1 endoplasmic reticulum-Golgi intermediate compartment protein 2 [Nomia melanderi]XP_031847596.1 endoplasmic reticulum-Golgi intermediate compartment protein 2 [Nomia melanderi]XP_031847597.1 endoplasmic reticulum-Golgi intermediate compartment protein 2 [Nomia melanderi]XP_031847598.1 endoplasmic reticulu
MLRRRKVNIKTVKELDAFPKVLEPYVDKTAVGGTFSIFTICTIAYLIIAETNYYLNSRLQFKFEPDTDIDAKLKINIDITVAMPCGRIGADVLDSTNQNMIGHQTLVEEDTWWELTSEQRSHFEALKHMNSYLREEYHAIHELLWKSNQVTLYSEMPKRTHEPSYAPNACRIHGSLNVNKVAGNFHITAGKSLSIPKGHIHISAFMTDKHYNFTHRINKFSFGGPSPGIVHPLEGDEKIADNNMILYQYFVEVVPTDIQTLLSTSKTYQYSVKDHERPIDHQKGSHGIPGIFFKYDMSALKIKVTQQRDTICQFLVKLCATIGGIFVTSGLIKNVVQSFWYVMYCKFLSSKDDKNDRNYSNSMLGQNHQVPGTINLLHVSAPECVDIMLKPQPI